MDEKAIGVSRVYGGRGDSFFNLAHAGGRNGYTRIQHGRFGGGQKLTAQIPGARVGGGGGVRADISAAQNAGCPATETPFNGEHKAGLQVLNTSNFADDHGPLRDVTSIPADNRGNDGDGNGNHGDK